MPAIAPRVSIGLPVYNGSSYLRSAITSLLGQDYPNFGIFVSDNASTDETPAICRTFCSLDRRIRYHRNDANLGAAKNFNTVFEESDGKYFMWAAHDDQWAPQFLTKCVEALEKYPEVVLCSTDICFVDRDGAKTTYPRDFNRLNTFTMGVRERLKTLTEKLDWFAIYGVIRVDALRQTRLSTDAYGADVILLAELLLRGASLILPEPLFSYRFIQKTAQQHLEDITGSVQRGEFKPYTGLAQELLRIIKESEYANDLKIAMRDDLVDNVCKVNSAWGLNILNENPPVREVDPFLWHTELRKLVQSSWDDFAPRDSRSEVGCRIPLGALGANRRHLKRFGFNVIGFVSGNLGLGVSARNTIDALLSHDFPVAVLDIDPGEGRAGYDTRFAHLAVRSSNDLPYDINLVIFPPNLVQGLVLHSPGIFARPDRVNVACTFWELPVLPDSWLRAFECFDVVLTFSDFIQHALDFRVSGPFVISARQPLFLPEQVASQRERFGIAEGDVVFVTSLEFGSDPLRKNAHATIEAFLKGVVDVPNARLVVRINNVFAGMPGTEYLLALQRAAALDSRISLRTEKLSYLEVLSLYRSADVYVSLHRSEGLGLAPLEAMALGKPVIATAWSGNMTYMDHANSCLVAYTLVPVKGSVSAYSEETLKGLSAVWAEPDIEQAAIWMKRLAGDASLRAEIGRRAAASVGAYASDAAKASFAYQIRDIWQHLIYADHVPNWDLKLDALRAAVSRAQPPMPPRENPVVRFRRRVGRYLEEHVLGSRNA